VLPSGRLHTKTRAFAILVVLSNAFGNFSLTWGMKHRGEELTLSPLSYVQAIFTPWVALGIALLILWMLARMALLSWADLSYVLPVTSLGYVANALIGRLFLSEHITRERWLGTLLIVVGTALVSMGDPHTGHPKETQ
jgi:drug/metabolite transporter (DMT)-like permease